MSAPCPQLYLGRVMHLRMLGAKKHQFRYSVFRLLLDIDRIGETLNGLRTVGHNRFNLYGFYERDHGPRDGSALRPWVETLLAREGVETPKRIMLYCFPRMAGFGFNPLAMYCAYDECDRLSGIVYQVRNTDGDLSPYVANVARDGLRHEAEKTFYVSPFIDENQRYAFTLTPLGDALNLRIRVDSPRGLTLIATENVVAKPLTDAVLLRLAVVRPFMTLKITVGIYFEALRLRLKGARFFRHPGNRGVYPNDETRTPQRDTGPFTGRTKEVRDTQ